MVLAMCVCEKEEDGVSITFRREVCVCVWACVWATRGKLLGNTERCLSHLHAYICLLYASRSAPASHTALAASRDLLVAHTPLSWMSWMSRIPAPGARGRTHHRRSDPVRSYDVQNVRHLRAGGHAEFEASPEFNSRERPRPDHPIGDGQVTKFDWTHRHATETLEWKFRPLA